MRLDKFLSYHGFGSRQQVKKLIKRKLVTINDLVCVDDGKHVSINDMIKVEGQQVTWVDKVYYMLNKPKGYVCANEDKLYPTVFALIQDYLPPDCFVVGRLDVDTEGLVLISNDGRLAHQLLNNKKHVPKVYEVHAVVEITDGMISQLETGVIIDGGLTLPAKVKLISSQVMELTITEGRFHQVKKMLMAVGNEVGYLKRLKINHLVLDPNLALGQSRPLTDEEITRLNER